MERYELVLDQLMDRRGFRIHDRVNDCTRECPDLVVTTSVLGRRVANAYIQVKVHDRSAKQAPGTRALLSY